MLARFRGQGGVKIELHLVRIADEEKYKEQAETGNAKAQLLLGYMVGWYAKASSITPPPCPGCNKTITPMNIAGFAILTPVTAGATIGLVTAICETCINNDRENVIHKVIEMANRETGGELHTLQ